MTQKVKSITLKKKTDNPKSSTAMEIEVRKVRISPKSELAVNHEPDKDTLVSKPNGKTTPAPNSVYSNR